MYIKCPLCKKKTSENTIRKTGECNDCQSERILSYYNEPSYRISKIKSEYASILLKEFIVFIGKSEYKNVFKNRLVIDFIKLMKGYDGKNKLKEAELVVDYYNKSAIKSPKYILLIKAFLVSKEILLFKTDGFDSFFPKDIRPERRFKQNVCTYLFESKYCSDCGELLTSKNNNNYCYDCLAYRIILKKTTTKFLDETFYNSSISGLYKKFVYYLYNTSKKIQTIAKNLSNTVDYFIYIQNISLKG